MVINKIRASLRKDLEAPAADRRFGSGWISGVISLVLSVAALLGGLCVLSPGLFTVSEARALYTYIPYRLLLQGSLAVSFVFAILSLTLRKGKVLGSVSLATTLIGFVLFQIGETTASDLQSPLYLGLDWFILNILFTGLLFIPIERLYPKTREQGIFRVEWREDLFYYLVSSLFVQGFTYLSLFPSLAIVRSTDWGTLRHAIGSQPMLIQIIEIMFLTDFVQYWVHRAFHRIPFLWNFHAVHHSAQAMDWMAGARMHLIEIIVLRGLTVIPMQILGFSATAVQSYILIVYIYSTFLHANFRWSPRFLSGVLATPRFHHWHHGIEREAIDVNFSIHFPLFDRAFGTYYMPGDKWPSGYGIQDHPVPAGYVRQLLYPLQRKRGIKS